MTGRPSTKIPFLRTPTPNYPLPIFLIVLIVLSLGLLCTTLMLTALLSMSPFIQFPNSVSAMIGLVGIVLPIMVVYFLVKGKPSSKWIAVLQILAPVALLDHLIRYQYIDWEISSAATAAILFIAIATVFYLLFSNHIQAYYSWLEGDTEGAVWVSERHLKLSEKISGADNIVTTILEWLFIILALVIFGFIFMYKIW